MTREEVKTAKGITCQEANALRIIQRVMDRLYSERTMSGDEMRDNAQLLQAVLDQTFTE